MRKIDPEQLKYPKVPIEIALEDLMLELAYQQVKCFHFVEKEDWQFILWWKEKDLSKCINVQTNSMLESDSLRKTFTIYVKDFNKRIRKGEFLWKTRPQIVAPQPPEPTTTTLPNKEAEAV